MPSIAVTFIAVVGLIDIQEKIYVCLLDFVDVVVGR